MADYDPRRKIQSIFRETKKREIHPVYHFINNGNINGDVIIQTSGSRVRKRRETDKE